jgi:glyoxylase-like metal-dependent hydrolase (beta-lactamase superfamily II)
MRPLRQATAIVFRLLIALGAVGASTAAPAPRAVAPAGWFHVYALDAHTYAISEPKYWQQNVSYLLIGMHHALLFDAGPGVYGIRAEVERLTKLPIIAVPSHLHFDHVGDLPEFSDVRLLDTPALRAQVHDGYFIEPPLQYMLASPFRYRIAGWIKDGQIIDLGGRTVRLLSTPGHTPDSVSLVDQDEVRLFTGDLVNRVVSLFAVPGSDVAAAASSLHHLLTFARADTLTYEAHAEMPLTRAELEQLASGIAGIAAGRNRASTKVCLGDTPMLRYTAGPFPILLPLPGGPRQKPLGSVNATVNFEGDACK